MKNIIDAGVNLTDKMYKGIYNGKAKHVEDIKAVIDRAFTTGISKIFILGGSLEDSREAAKLSEMDERLYFTVGCHPTNCNEYETSPDTYTTGLLDLVSSSKRVIAIGECGLDYDRTNFCSVETQRVHFELQLSLAAKTQLPLYLHCRAAHADFTQMLQKHRQQLLPTRPGLVHSFDGTSKQADQLIEMGFAIGVNGCSLKTTDNLEVIKQLPLTSIVIETDAPWCEVRPSHAGYKFIKTFSKSVKKEKWNPEAMVKSRNEPANVVQVLEIICGIRDESEDEICSQIFKNTEELFFGLCN